MRYTFADLVQAAQAMDAVERMLSEVEDFADPVQGDGTIEFFDIRTGDAFDVPPEQAMAYFRSKGLRTSFSYADALGEANDAAFTVAKMMDVDLLKQVRDSLDSALANGVSFGAWKKELAPILKAAGWWGDADVTDPATGITERAKLGSAWRLETIFRTNMQTAYATGQWRTIQAQADIAPFLMYDAVDDFRTRPMHASWDDKVLPVASPWWQTHYPPNGYNCRCGVIQLDRQQLDDLGITPLADPPDDGTYQWTNPRTGKVETIPNGIDPGFARPPATGGYNADLKRLMAEKLQALPEPMQEAVSAASRDFDTSTAAGKWHAASFGAAPSWLKNAVLQDQSVQVEQRSRTAFARMGAMIDMDGYTEGKANGQSVWRHEFGHIMDVRLATNKIMYRSADPDFADAQKADADELVLAAGRGRKSRANDAKRAAVVNAYEAARNRIIDADRDERPAMLAKMAEAAGIDFEKFKALLKQSTLVLDLGDDLRDVGVAVRVARMIEAVRLGDGEGFLRFASFKDSIDEAVAQRQQIDKAMMQSVSQSWRKDGALSSLSDLIGSATRNKAADYRSGFPGHTTAYYRAHGARPTTESFANLTALAGHGNAYWWELVQRFTPRMAEAFRKIIEGKA